MELTSLRVLLIEDDDDHAALVEAHLEDADDPAVDLTRAATVADAVAALAEACASGCPFDVVLSDQRLPDSEYWETVGRVVAAAGQTPVIALTSIGDTEIAVDALRQGAQDYLVKADLEPEILRRTLRYAAERARRTAELHATNEALRQTLAHVRQMQVQIVEQEKLAGLGGLLAGVAHELRNPLHLTVGFADAAAVCAEALDARLGDALRSEAADELAELRTHLAKVVEHGHRTDRVLRSMFEHARGVAGELRPVDLHASLEVALAQVNPASAGVCVDRAFDAALAGPSVVAIGEAITRALYNVVENAVLASTDGGSIRISTHPVVSSSGIGRHAVVVVEDDGPGMPDEVAARVFEPFYTAWAQGHRIGLGLTLAHSIVASHGGRISVSARPQGGTAVRLSLPMTAIGSDDGRVPTAPA